MVVNVNESFLWDCFVCNNQEMDRLFGLDWNNNGLFWDLEQGRQMKWLINNIENNGTSFNINIGFWKWQSGDSWGIADEIVNISYLIDPRGYPNNLNLSSELPFVPFLFPTPLDDYLEGLRLNEIYSLDTRVLQTINLRIPKDYFGSDYPSSELSVIAIYNYNGVLDHLKFYLTGNVVILEVSHNFLPIYVIPALIGLIGVLVIGVSIYFIKIRRSK